MTKYSSFDENRSLNVAETIFNQRIADAISIFKKHHLSFKRRDCPICGGLSKKYADKFHGTYSIAKCDRCQSEYVDPVPSFEAIKDYYQNCKCNLMLAELTRNRAVSFNIDDRVRTIVELIRNADNSRISILEIGSSSGRFLSSLRNFLCDEFPEKKFDFYGIDIDKDAVEKRVDQNIDIKCLSAESLAELSISDRPEYDLILHYELIEHLADPFSFMQSVKVLLKPGGLTVFTTPNSCGAENLASGYNTRRLIAHAIFPPMHLNAFSTQNINLFSYRCGLELIKLETPGKLDVDMICKNEEFLTDSSFSMISELGDDKMKEILQSLIVTCFSSSHMQVILRKPINK
jgi:2-polyprenyl-6-hydroxyphenyl methylase/3-demethylubiquinone-9 3-methyltransferase